MGKRFAFDIAKAIPAAWKFIWENYAKEREENKKEKHVYRPDRVLYATASDLENQVRSFAKETSEGKEWGSAGMAYGRDYWSRVRLPGNLNGRVRSWLLDEVSRGRLESHNFGRGHISGMRFRPKGAEKSEAELKTLAKNEERRKNPKPRLCHLAKGGGCACAKKTSPWSRSTAWTTKDAAKVTCPRCLKIAATKKEAA